MSLTRHHGTGGRAGRALITALVAALLGLAGLVAAGPASADSPAGPGWLRVGHLAAGTPKADVLLTPFSGGDTVTLRAVPYGAVSPYWRLPAGLYTVALVKSAGTSDAPMVSRSVRVESGSAQFVAVTKQGDGVRAQVLQDDLAAPPAGQARLRLVSATGGAPVTAQVVDGPVLAEDVASGTATGYADVDAQTWSIRLTSEGTDDSVSDVTVKAGGVYTLLVLESGGGKLRLSAVQDSGGSSEMPIGAVDSGGGFLARSGAHQPVIPALALAALVASLTGLLLVARRPGSPSSP